MDFKKHWVPTFNKRPSLKRLSIGVATITAGFWFAFAPGSLPVTFGFDRHEDTCLPVKSALLVKIAPRSIVHGDYLIFKPFGVLLNNDDPWVIKLAKGVAGDHLVISNGVVKINDQVITEGMASAPLFHKSIPEFDKDEIIPQGKVYVIGTHPYALDSRYWGYLDQSQIIGTAYPLL